MELDQQIQELVDGAPQDGRTPQAVQAIAPVLEQVAKRLQHTQYYVLQTLDQRWVITTLSNRTQPEVEKNVVYVFPRLEDAAASPDALLDPQLVAMPIPVIQLLFQTTTLSSVDSIIFLDVPGNLELGTEISCQDVQTLIQTQLQQTLFRNRVPPDLA